MAEGKRKKQIRRLIIIGIILGLLLVGCSVLNDPPMGDKTVTDPKKYMKVNSYVADWLDNRNPMDQFPEKIPENCEVEYCYHYRCGFDWPDFFIDLKLHFEDEGVFQTEKARLAKAEPMQILQDGNKSYLLFWYSQEFVRYMSDWRGKGMQCLFRATVIDEDTNTVEHLYAVINNPGYRPDEISHIAEPVWKLLNKETLK